MPNDSPTLYASETAEDEVLASLKEAGLLFDKDLCSLNIPQETIAYVSKELATQYHIVPVTVDDMGMLLVVSDSADALRNVGAIQKNIKNVYTVKVLVSGEDNVKAALRKYYDIQSYRQIIRSSGGSYQDEADDSALKRRIRQLLDWAIDQKASDLHLIPYSNGIFVRIRINGFLKDVSEEWNFLPEDGPLVVNILKGMDQSGKSSQQKNMMPNSGHFVLVKNGVPIECRLQTNPLGDVSNRREHADIRFLPQIQSIKTLEAIYTGRDYRDIRQTLYKSGSGMYIWSGPVGTGKSTSIKAAQEYIRALYEASGRELNIFDIENPIEYVDERNIQVEERFAKTEELNLDAMTALRSALRSDPDIIVYGEIRDSADAKVATRACQTGLRMFTTVHAGDCIRTVNRLLDLDVSRMSLLAELKLIVCQRLLGVLCPHCSRPHVLTEDEKNVLTKEELRMLEKNASKIRERGTPEDRKRCPHCQDGLKGRIAIPEYIVFTDTIRNELLNMKTFDAVPRLLKSHGFQSMWQKGLGLVMQGQAELSDVIQKIGRD